MQPSDVRASDMLANERTYLAYVRTGLAFIAFGFVLARFSLFAREISVVAHITIEQTGAASTAVGSVMALIGIVVGAFGGYRYAATERALREGRALALSPAIAYAGSLVIAATGLLVAISIAAAR